MPRLKYRKKADQAVTAIQLDLDIDGFTYNKWGNEQRAKRGDWLVENDSGNEHDVYTVDSESFARTYERVDKGRYIKKVPVWAEVASQSGRIQTKEGHTEYQHGDYLVYNEPDRGDGYAMEAAKFEAMYERVVEWRCIEDADVIAAAIDLVIGPKVTPQPGQYQRRPA